MLIAFDDEIHLELARLYVEQLRADPGLSPSRVILQPYAVSQPRSETNQVRPRIFLHLFHR